MFCPKCGMESTDDSQFCRKCGSGLLTPTTAVPLQIKQPVVRPLFVVVLLLGLVILGWMWDHASHQQAARSVPKTAIERDNANIADFYGKQGNEPVQPSPQLRTVNIGRGALSVAAMHLSFYMLAVPAGAHNVRVQGHFQASGGIGNDIEVLLLKDEQFTNWKNGHTTPTYYYSGKITVGDVQAVLPDGPGAYYLVFNNNFSALTAKAVVFNGTMTYYQ